MLGLWRVPSLAFCAKRNLRTLVFRRPLWESVNGEGRDKANQQNNPQTGWNHKLPSKDSSFWQGSEAGRTSSSSSSQDNELRTGWLHNTRPAGKQKDATTPAQPSGKARRTLELAMKQQERNHRIVSAPTFHACGEGLAIVTTDHRIALPVSRFSKQPRTDVAFTIVERVGDNRQFFADLAAMKPVERAKAYVQKAALTSADGLFLYLQGGPGFGAPTPVVGLSLGKDASWASAALDKYERIVLMDQRGTGRSTPVTKQRLQRQFPDLFLLDDQPSIGSTLDDYQLTHPELAARVSSAVVQVVDYLINFRADNIVLDAEEIRDALLLPIEDEADDKPRPWGGSLGQSYGGFCQMTYLSQVADPPRTLLFTGGIAPMLTPAYHVYFKLWDHVKERSLRYYEMFPDDVPLIKTIVRKLLDEPARLPSGGRLTARRFLQLGLALGGSPSSFASLHSLFRSAFVDALESVADSADLEFSRAFLKQIEVEQSFDDHPIYFWLHESIYGDGSFNEALEWAAHRAYEDKCQVAPEFDYRQTCADASRFPVLFFGEMVFPWMSEDYAELSGIGLAAVAEALAQKDDWTPLFNGDNMRVALEDKCRAAAAVYYEDMYVEFDACMKVLARRYPLERCKEWVTNDYQHSGLRDDGAKIFAKLYATAEGSIRTPS